MRKSSDARLRANAKWDAENAERISVKLYKSKGLSKADIQAAAAVTEQSVNEWIVDAIRAKLEAK